MTSAKECGNIAVILEQFIARAQWRATAKSFIIEARDEDEALDKALKSKEAKGCIQVTITKRFP